MNCPHCQWNFLEMKANFNDRFFYDYDYDYVRFKCALEMETQGNRRRRTQDTSKKPTPNTPYHTLAFVHRPRELSYARNIRVITRLYFMLTDPELRRLLVLRPNQLARAYKFSVEAHV